MLPRSPDAGGAIVKVIKGARITGQQVGSRTTILVLEVPVVEENAQALLALWNAFVRGLELDFAVKHSTEPGFFALAELAQVRIEPVAATMDFRPFQIAAPDGDIIDAEYVDDEQSMMDARRANEDENGDPR